MRDEFPPKVREAVAHRAGMRCSNPRCQKITSGPQSDPNRAINIGVAAHITAASSGGPRFDADISSGERSSINNAIWLCQSCSKLIDSDIARFRVDVLKDWRRRAENTASWEIASSLEFRPIASNEVKLEMSLGEYLAIKALSDEFRCHIETDIKVPTQGEGWLRLDGAVVRGEELVGIDLFEHQDDRNIPYFQLEHLIEVIPTLTFKRFCSMSLWVAVVSDTSPDLDPAVQVRLEEICLQAPFEIQIRMYRLNTLRAKYAQ